MCSIYLYIFHLFYFTYYIRGRKGLSRPRSERQAGFSYSENMQDGENIFTVASSGIQSRVEGKEWEANPYLKQSREYAIPCKDCSQLPCGVHFLDPRHHEIDKHDGTRLDQFISSNISCVWDSFWVLYTYTIIFLHRVTTRNTALGE